MTSIKYEIRIKPNTIEAWDTRKDRPGFITGNSVTCMAEAYRYLAYLMLENARHLDYNKDFVAPDFNLIEQVNKLEREFVAE